MSMVEQKPRGHRADLRLQLPVKPQQQVLTRSPKKLATVHGGAELTISECKSCRVVTGARILPRGTLSLINALVNTLTCH